MNEFGDPILTFMNALLAVLPHTVLAHTFQDDGYTEVLGYTAEVLVLGYKEVLQEKGRKVAVIVSREEAKEAIEARGARGGAREAKIKIRRLKLLSVCFCFQPPPPRQKISPYTF